MNFHGNQLVGFAWENAVGRFDFRCDSIVVGLDAGWVFFPLAIRVKKK